MGDRHSSQQSSQVRRALGNSEDTVGVSAQSAGAEAALVSEDTRRGAGIAQRRRVWRGSSISGMKEARGRADHHMHEPVNGNWPNPCYNRSCASLDCSFTGIISYTKPKGAEQSLLCTSMINFHSFLYFSLLSVLAGISNLSRSGQSRV